MIANVEMIEIKQVCNICGYQWALGSRASHNCEAYAKAKGIALTKEQKRLISGLRKLKPRMIW